MIWHIFKKDLRLTWPLAVLVTAIHWLNASLLISGGRFARSAIDQVAEFEWVTNIALPGVALLGLVILVVALVHQDRLPGTTQDWLTRPIPRAYLLGSKMLSVVLVGLAPIFIADVAMGLAEQLSVVDVMLASLTRGIMLLLFVCLPAALIGAVTRSFAEALVLAVIVVVLLAVELIALVQIRLEPPLFQSGYFWTGAPVVALLNAAALAILLPLQSRWRSTNRVRWILAGYFCAIPVVLFLPWEVSIQVHSVFDLRGNDANTTVSLDAARQIEFDSKFYDVGQYEKQPFVWVNVPIKISNEGAENLVFVDRVVIRSKNAKSAVDDFQSTGWERQSQRGYFLKTVAGRSNQVLDIPLSLPVGAFERARRNHTHLEVELYGTKFRLTGRKPMRLLAAESIDDHARCYERTSVRFARGNSVIYCVSARPVGECIEIENSPGGHGKVVDMSNYKCRGASYAPWPLPVWRDPYYSTEVFSSEEWQQSAAQDASPESNNRNEPVAVNYASDTHFVRSIRFDLGSARERPGTSEWKSVDGEGIAARFATPTGIVRDSRGNLFVVDEADSVIRKVTSAGVVTTIAGAAHQSGNRDGPGVDARFRRPHGIAIDSADNLIVTDTGNGLIRRISSAGVVSTVVGAPAGSNEVPSPLRFKDPRGAVVAPDGSIYVIDFQGAQSKSAIVSRISPAGVVSLVAGPADPIKTPGHGEMTLELPADSNF